MQIFLTNMIIFLMCQIHLQPWNTFAIYQINLSVRRDLNKQKEEMQLEYQKGTICLFFFELLLFNFPMYLSYLSSLTFGVKNQKTKHEVSYFVLTAFFFGPFLAISNPLNISVVVRVFSDLNRRVSYFFNGKKSEKKLIFTWFMH